MTNVFILALIALILGFSLSFAGLYIYLEKSAIIISSSLKKELAFAPIYLSCLILFSILYFITPISNDFINDFSTIELFIPMILAGICYLISLFPKTEKFINLALIIAIAVSCFVLPQNFLLFNGYLPLWADRLAIIAIWSLFSCFYNILNKIDGLLPTFNSSYLMTLSILALFDAAPIFLGLMGLGFFAINSGFFIFNWFPAKITLTDKSCKIFGFLIGYIIVLGCSENLTPCFAIVLTIFALELLQSFIKKLSLHHRYDRLDTNTICYQAHIKGLTPEQVCFSIFKIQILFIILGSFQAYLPNNYSLPIASLFLAAWFLNKLQNWDEPKQNLKEINQEFMSDLRQNINDIKNTINRD